MEEENKNVVDESKINGLEEEMVDVKSNKNISGLYVLIVFLILLVVGILLFKFLVNKSSNNAINNSNNDNVSVVTKSDDVTSNDDVTSSDDVNFDSHYKAVKEVTLNNDYEDDTVALIYRCKSEHCDILNLKNGILVYDDETFIFKKYSDKEYENIFSKEINLIQPSILYYDDFEIADINKLVFYDNQDFGSGYIFSYYNDIFALKIESQEDDVKVECISDNKLDNLVFYLNYIIDLSSNKIIYSRYYTQVYVDIEKVGSFYVFKSELNATGPSTSSIFNLKAKYLMDLFDDEYYIENDKLYYINNGVLNITNMDNELISQINDIKSMALFNNLLLYADVDGRLSVKNMVTDDVVFKHDINIRDYDLDFSIYVSDEDKYIIEIIGYFLRENGEYVDVNSNFKKFISDNKLGPIDYDNFLKNGEGNAICYMMTFDKNGELIDTDFIVDLFF